MLDQVEIAYETWGELSPKRDNVVVVCHALTGDQFAASPNPVTGRPAWWDLVVGPGLPVDTNRFFVICSNVLGGCMGSTGPASRKPDGAYWGTDFPIITIADMVRAQIALLEQLGIDDVFLAIGGSIGGMQVLEWTIQARDRVFAADPDRRRCPPVGPEHRLLRGRPPGDHGRPQLARRRLPCRRHAA